MLSRHLVERGCGPFTAADRGEAASPRLPGLGRLHRRATRTRFRGFVIGLAPVLDRLLYRLRPTEGRPDLILTVAHGESWLTAMRIARRDRLPLVTIFHDWYPDASGASPGLVPLWDRAFRRLYRASALALCVSEQLRDYLGPHPNAVVLPPIPADPPRRPVAAAPGRSRPGGPRLFYAGLCGGLYRPLLTELAAAVGAAGGWGFDVCGPDAAEALPEPPTGVTIHGDVPAGRREAIAAGADAAVVVLSFDPAKERHLRLHFPSKLIEYLSWGRPIVVWGPPYASAVRWAEVTGAAVAVSSRDPADVLAAADTVAAGATRAAVLGRAGELARTEFHPDRIHERFVDGLHKAVRRHRNLRTSEPAEPEAIFA